MKKRILSLVVCIAILLGCLDTIVWGYGWQMPGEIQEGTYIIVSAIDENKALDISGQSPERGTNVHLWSRHSGDTQKFKISKNGEYYKIRLSS